MAGREIAVSNPAKVLFPKPKYTKLDLVRYYDAIFPKLRPYVKDRPYVLRRCPNGMRGRCFWQKEKPESMPARTPTARVVHTNGVSAQHSAWSARAGMRDVARRTSRIALNAARSSRVRSLKSS